MYPLRPKNPESWIKPCKKQKIFKKKSKNNHGGPYEPSGYVRSGVPRGVPHYGVGFVTGYPARTLGFVAGYPATYPPTNP